MGYINIITPSPIHNIMPDFDISEWNLLKRRNLLSNYSWQHQILPNSQSPTNWNLETEPHIGNFDPELQSFSCKILCDKLLYKQQTLLLNFASIYCRQSQWPFTKTPRKAQFELPKYAKPLHRPQSYRNFVILRQVPRRFRLDIRRKWLGVPKFGEDGQHGHGFLLTSTADRMRSAPGTWHGPVPESLSVTDFGSVDGWRHTMAPICLFMGLMTENLF